MLQLHAGEISIVLCTPSTNVDTCHIKMHQELYSLTGWLAPLIFDASLPWMDDGATIEKKVLNIVAQHSFRFISGSIILCQNESILWHRKALPICPIIENEQINVSTINVKEIFLCAKQDQTSLLFPFLISQLCERECAPFWGKLNVRITKDSSNYI